MPDPRQLHSYTTTTPPEYTNAKKETSAAEDEEEEEYAQFLEAERKQFEAAAKSSKKRKNYMNVYEEDRKTSTRRRVREMDELSGGNDILDYGEGPSTSVENANPGGNESSAHKPDVETKTTVGKRIWWPVIGN